MELPDNVHLNPDAEYAQKILNALEHNGSPKPEFETDDARSYFISRFFIHEGFLQEPNERSLSEVGAKNERSFETK